MNQLAAGIFGVVLAGLLTIPVIVRIARQIRQSIFKARAYQDKDGISTEELTSACSATVSKTLLLVLGILGLFNSITIGVLGVLETQFAHISVENWLSVGEWLLLVVQIIAVALLRDSVRRFNIGLCTALSSVILLVVALNRMLAPPEISYARNGLKLVSGLHIIQLCLAVFIGVLSMCLPRRPEVYFAGEPVDAQFTVSALRKYTFGWVDNLIKLAQKNGRLEFEDIPKIDHDTRADNLIQIWGGLDASKPLWAKILLCYKKTLILQWILTAVQSVGSFAPQLFNLKLLRILENRQPGAPADPEIWIWVILLYLSTNAASWVNEWAFWVSWGGMAVKIRSQLSALIFRKAMQRKDLKTALNSKNIDPINENMETRNEAKDDDFPQGTQSTVNLISVDAKRVSDFCAINNFLPNSVFKLAIAVVFLQDIIGWRPLISGILVMFFTVPLNIYVGKKYKRAQYELMKLRDAKLAIVTEALQGIRQIKFSAQESNWHEKISCVRNGELVEQWKVYKTNTVLLFCWIFSPIALSATSLSVYAYINEGLDAATAFTAIGIFGNLELALSAIPDLISRLLEAWVSVNRIEKYLEGPEVTKNTKNATSISFEGASFAWPSDASIESGGHRYVLRDVNLAFPPNELSVIGGKTGSGKSLLLAAILGEVDILSGSISVPHSPDFDERRDELSNRHNWIIPSAIAFVSQIPWIENDNFRNNILFGLPFDEYRYKKVIEVCALRKDLEMLTDGEWTEIGANGINLSGGQRWRVAFARALYSRAGILILDDIFSAVDAHVGRFIFEKGLAGELGVGRTRILVTHHVALCETKTKYFVELGDGTVERAGLKSELEIGALQTIISPEEAEFADVEDDHTVVNSGESSDVETAGDLMKGNLGKVAKKFVEEESREKGRVKGLVYKIYIKSSGGWPFWIAALILFGSHELLTLGQSWWLNIWTGNAQFINKLTLYASIFTLQTPFESPRLRGATPSTPQTHELAYYLGIYIGLSIAVALLGTLRFFFVFTGSIRASRKLFNKLSDTVLRTPLRWIDTVPLGRILNRFTGDFAVVDSTMAFDMALTASSLLALIGVVGAAVIVSPYIILLAVVLLALCVYLGILYITAAREIKRLESSSKSPIYEQFGSVLTGITTIRAFSKAPAYVARMQNQLDKHSSCSWYICVTNRWIGLRMALVGNFFTAVVAGLVVVFPISVSVAGFVLNFTNKYGSTVATLIRQYADLELAMNAAERVIEYTTLPTETLDGFDPPAAWPSERRLEVHNLVVGYAPDLPPVLKGLSFSVERKERIGVIGRTGAGKSSLTLALFRFLEARQGSIYIDGIDISKIKLYALRSRLAIIPQDPVLFSGTVRSNLDPFGAHTDLELRDALERVQLVAAAEFIQTPPDGSSTPILNEDNYTGRSVSSHNRNHNYFASLSSQVTHGGLNLSQGQRQLLCLARAIASRPKILVLDEATSAVDMETDNLIQRSIREEFKDSTLIVIAHRLSTIADFDKILVLDDGKTVEFGTPRDLIQLEDGVFSSMVRESGEGRKLFGTILGSGTTIKTHQSMKELRNVFGV